MRKVIYRGQFACNVSTHGLIQPGGAIIVPEVEWTAMKTSEEFELAPTQPEKSREGTHPILPQETEAYDLRKIAWNSGALHRLLSNFNRTKLANIARGMEQLGLPTRYGVGLQPQDVIDSIQYHAENEGWTKMRPEEIMAAGKFVARVRRKAV